MKKFIILFLLISSNLYADKIPGWIDLDLNAQRWYGIGNNMGWGLTEFDFKYGAKIYQVKPYFHCGYKTFIDTASNVYYAPFREIYTFGGGFKIYDVFYIEYVHKCAHFVRTAGNDANAFYEGYNGTAHNIIKAGIRIQID